MIKVDTHFHTNFSFLSEYLIKRRALQFWAAFKKHGIDAVIITEHAFKSPVSSYESLMKYKPKDAKTHVIPGVEVVLKKGIDVIVFSKDKYVYSKKKLLTPYCLSLDEVIDLIKSDDRLFGVLTHPFILSDTGVVFHYGEKVINKYSKDFGIIEKHNAALFPLKKALESLKLHKLLSAFYCRLKKIEDVPANLFPKETVVFGGSDAHYPRDIGSHLEIKGDASSYEDMFKALLNPELERKFVCIESSFPIPLYMLINGLTTFFETIKKRTRLFYLTTVDDTFKK